MQGWIFTANEKTAAVSFCDSPYHMSVSVEACRLINLQPEALAVALAIMVFPHPGGPNNKTPARTKYEQNFLIPAYITQKCTIPIKYTLFEQNNKMQIFTDCPVY